MCFQNVHVVTNKLNGLFQFKYQLDLIWLNKHDDHSLKVRSGKNSSLKKQCTKNI